MISKIKYIFYLFLALSIVSVLSKIQFPLQHTSYDFNKPVQITDTWDNTYKSSMDEKLNYATVQWIMSINSKIDEAKAQAIVDAVNEYSKKRNMDHLIVYGIIYAETRFQVKAHNSYGAHGLMQVVPRWHYDKIANRDIFDINVNIEVGTKVLADCDRKYRGQDFTRAISCYNGGASQMYNWRVQRAQKALNTRLNAVLIASGKKPFENYQMQKIRLTDNSYTVAAL